MLRKLLVIGFLGSLLFLCAEASAGELLIGAGSADITPDKPVGLDGQMHLRISKNVDTPITANVLALESRDGERSLDSAVMVSCDLVTISATLLDKLRPAVQKRLPDFDMKKLILNATHTHTAPVTRPDVYEIPKTGVMQPEEYCEFAAEKIADAIEKAWKSREAGSFTWGLGHAAVAENRRATYAGGHAVMYGATNTPDFRGLEGYVDHDLGAMFFWNKAGKLIAMAVNVSCPAQEVEGLSSINADFWHPVRESLRKKYGSDLCVLGWIGAAGDFSPHPMIGRKHGHLGDAADERMRQLRKLSRLEEIARRIVGAVDEVFETVKDDRHADVPFVHKVESFQLPMRLVTDQEYAEAQKKLAEKPAQVRGDWYRKIIARYERQKTDPNPTVATEIHTLRIGDAAVCTNNFELFNAYGIQIKARSLANQTFIIQLTGGGSGSYLATEQAVRCGGYSAIVQSNLVSPQGGQIFVDRTVELLDSLWPKTKVENK